MARFHEIAGKRNSAGGKDPRAHELPQHRQSRVEERAGARSLDDCRRIDERWFAAGSAPEKRYYSARFGQPHPQAQKEMAEEIKAYQYGEPGWSKQPHVQRVLRMLGRTVDGLLTK